MYRFRPWTQHIGEKSRIMPGILKRSDYITRIFRVQALSGERGPFPSFPAGVRRFCGKCYFCYFFITGLLPLGTPSKLRVLHIIHKVIHIVMSTAKCSEKFRFGLSAVRMEKIRGISGLQLTSPVFSCMITVEVILKTILWGVLYDLQNRERQQLRPAHERV